MYTQKYNILISSNGWDFITCALALVLTYCSDIRFSTLTLSYYWNNLTAASNYFILN